MPGRLPLLAGILVFGILVGGCDGGSTPTTPTTPPAAPPPTAAPPPPPPAEPASLSSLTLNPSTIVSQGNPEGTVTLTAAAPANTVVALSSGNRDIARVPENVMIPAGSTSGTFRIETATVAASSIVTIEATYAGVTRTSPLTVLPPPLEPRFTVTSSSRGTDACDIVDSDGVVDCQFNASESRGFIATYLWTMKVGSTEMTFSTPDDQVVVTPVTRCGFLGNGTAEDGRVPLEVSLQLEDRSGNRSGLERRTIALHHNSRCGY